MPSRNKASNGTRLISVELLKALGRRHLVEGRLGEGVRYLLRSQHVAWILRRPRNRLRASNQSQWKDCLRKIDGRETRDESPETRDQSPSAPATGGRRRRPLQGFLFGQGRALAVFYRFFWLDPLVSESANEGPQCRPQSAPLQALNRACWRMAHGRRCCPPTVTCHLHAFKSTGPRSRNFNPTSPRLLRACARALSSCVTLRWTP